MFYVITLAILLANFICGSGQDDRNTHKIFFISDFQEPMAVEKVFLKTWRNEEARDSLFADMIRQQPENLFLIGDMTAAGSRSKDWLPLDNFMLSLRETSGRVYAVPGNHEYLFSPTKGSAQFKQRFPEKWLSGYIVNIDSIAVMMINSNFGNLTEPYFTNQLKWYGTAMDSLDHDPGTRSVIVCTHHAPYSNSAVVGSSEEVERLIVPAFEKSRKSILFISGHSHNLEYFVSPRGKHYLVIGGGGGITQPLLSMDKRTHQDLLRQESKPVYFYLIMEKDANRIKLTSRGFRDDFRFFAYTIGEINISR